MVNWVTLSLLYFLFAKIYKQNGLRIQDFFGTVALSRYPYLIFSLILLVISYIDPSIKTKVNPNSIYTFVIAAIGIGGVTWQVTTYFYALKEASGLNKKKLWIAFIFSLIIGEAISAGTFTNE